MTNTPDVNHYSKSEALADSDYQDRIEIERYRGGYSVTAHTSKGTVLGGAYGLLRDAQEAARLISEAYGNLPIVQP